MSDASSVERVVLRGAGTEAVLVPGLGNTCVAFRVGRWSVLAEPPDDEALLERTSRYGIPILFPWPNRIARGRFRFDGREVEVPTKGEHANHGFVRDRPWEVVARDTAWVRSRIRLDHPAFPAELTVEHRLVGDTLRITATARNVGSVSMPMGFGLHPYFAVPEAHRESCTVTVPASGGWVLDGFLPTGEVVPRTELRSGKPLGTDAYDDVFTALDLPFAATLTDPMAGSAVVVRSDAAFREHVVYAPTDRAVVCLEPYTCPTDAFNLEARGVSAGVVGLSPGEQWQGVVEIEAQRNIDRPPDSVGAIRGVEDR